MMTTKSERGFTLLEVLLAGATLTVLVVSVGVLFVSSAKVNAASGDQTECTALAQQRLESLRHVEARERLARARTHTAQARSPNARQTPGPVRSITPEARRAPCPHARRPGLRASHRHSRARLGGLAGQ